MAKQVQGETPGEMTKPTKEVDPIGAPDTLQIPRPVITELKAPYWNALDEGHLVFQRCRCGHAWLPARRTCPSCLGTENSWERASGRGRLISWVVYHTAYHEAFANRLPYNVAIVALEEGPQLITNIIDDGTPLRGDASVILEIQRVDGLALARFRVKANPETHPEN
jgi:uncharacterized protein